MSKSMLTFCLDLQKPNVYTAHGSALYSLSMGTGEWSVNTWE